jgi:hypothetical protein
VIRAKPRKRAAIAINEEYFFIDKLNILLGDRLDQADLYSITL